MKTLIRVPRTLAIETKKELSGPQSDAQKNAKGDYLSTTQSGQEAQAAALTSAGPDWKAIPTEPDPQKTAQ